ncbi:hypothetical protein BBJ29_002476 [Phytophthora kernoviae]|uniref:Peptidase A1 domain-containing protein n=1 Tax=Phytophthora kernoviae TaxID=325452 RepID=A0A3F2RZH3_9STRA|nr:hypothetical protein BBJ29_002476 [Phytophthora kernoviae]RLN66811.1 hypothetical protein BBP00_00001994 [Phytophthora kernoviae]
MSSAVWLLLLVSLLLTADELQADSAHYSIDLNGIASGTAYTLTVDIGTVDGSGSGSSNSFRLIADTGSSNDAVLGTGCCGSDAEVTYSCAASSTCTNSGGNVLTLAFAGANIQGQFMADTWSSSEIGSISKSFLVIEEQDTFYRSTYDGITGLAYKALASPTDNPVSSMYNVLVETAGSVDAFGMLLCGTMQPLLQTGGTDFSLHSGQLMIGGIDGTKGETYYTGDMLYSPITREAWYVVTVTDIGYDGTSLGLSCDNYNAPEAILDSGTSNMAFPTDVYNALMDQIKTATLNAIPDFDSSYFEDSASCCGEDYCDPTSSSAALLELPSIYFTLGMQSSDDSTTKHFTVEIPPEYYWRPEMNGNNASMPCRAIGISEGSSTILGDVFMDGLYAYHDRADGKVGLAVADNCPNAVNSTKKVYVSEASDDWCSCFSSTLKKKSTWITSLPWGSGCFFWLWWMYVVLASVVVVIACIGVLVWWYVTSRRMKQLQEEAQCMTGNRTSRVVTMQSSGSGRGAALAPAAQPSGYYAGSGSSRTASTRAGSRHGSARSSRSQEKNRANQKEKEVPMMPEPKYSIMSSPRSPLSSTSSIALLSPPNNSLDSTESWKQRSKPLPSGNRHQGNNNRRDGWGADLREDEF